MPRALTRESGYSDAVAGRPSETEYRFVNGVLHHQNGYVEYRAGYLAGLRAKQDATPEGQRGAAAAVPPRRPTRSRSDRAADVMMMALVTAFVWPFALIIVAFLLRLIGIQLRSPLLVWLVVLGPPFFILAGQLIGSWWELGVSGPLSVFAYYLGLPLLLSLVALVVFLLSFGRSGSVSQPSFMPFATAIPDACRTSVAPNAAA